MAKNPSYYVDNKKLQALLTLIYKTNDDDALNDFLIEAQKLGYKRVSKDKDIIKLDMIDDVIAYASISLLKAIRRQKFKVDGNLVSAIMQHFNYRLIDFKIKNNREIVRIENPKYYDNYNTYHIADIDNED